MTSERECFVYIVPPGETAFVTAGRFRLTYTPRGEPIGEFVYGRSYLERHNAVELDPAELKLGKAVYETARMGGFFGAIRDAMPDYWGRRVIERHAGKPLLEDFDYLLHGADDRAGALGFGLNPTPPAPRRDYNQTLDLVQLQRIADAIQKENNTGTDTAQAIQVQELLLAGTSMGGARPKAVVEDNGSLWMAKFTSPHDRWNHPRTEHAMLRLAHACGISVADSRLATVAGRDVLLVRRFDRDFAETGYHRHRMVSALTLLRSDDSPTARQAWSYLALADEIRRTSTHPEADLKELFARMCFNAAISNLDDHPRNHAMLAKDTGWRLSPAYDLTPMPNIAQDERHLAMSCGEHGTTARVKNLLSAHGRFLLSHEAADTVLQGIINTVKTQWDNCLGQAGLNHRDRAAIAGARLYPGLFY